MTKERPILFSTHMVQAILAGNKTMTRRELKQEWLRCLTIEEDYDKIISLCPYGQPGDILWVRESFARLNSIPFAGIPVKYLWKSDNEFPFGDNKKVKWKPSIHMPKGATRIWLEIESIKVERLQEITEEDAKAEGVKYLKWDNPMFTGYIDYLKPEGTAYHIAYLSFRSLWESINGAESWQANPWVWAITFKVLFTTGKPASIVNYPLSTVN